MANNVALFAQPTTAKLCASLLGQTITEIFNLLLPIAVESGSLPDMGKCGLEMGTWYLEIAVSFYVDPIWEEKCLLGPTLVVVTESMKMGGAS